MLIWIMLRVLFWGCEGVSAGGVGGGVGGAGGGVGRGGKKKQDGGEWKAKVVGEVSCYVRDGRLGISIPVVCVRVGGPQSIVYCSVSTSRSHHTGYPPCGGSRGGCRWDTCRGRGLFLCRRRVGGGGMPARAPPQSKKRKKRGCSGAGVAKGWALAQGGTLAASPEEDREVGGLSYTCSAGVPRHHVEAPPRTGQTVVIMSGDKDYAASSYGLETTDSTLFQKAKKKVCIQS